MAKRILIHLEAGIGDIIMETAAVNALVKLGHLVDVYIAGDLYRPIELFLNWDGPRHVSSISEDFTKNLYDYYLMASWVRRPLELENIKDTIIINCQYTKAFAHFGSQTDMMLQYAKAIDPKIDLNTPTYCGHSGRIFPEITKNTLVLFPGCRKTNPMKKWDKFDKLTESFSDVAVVGTLDDLDIENSVILPTWIEPIDNFLRYNGKIAKFVRLFGKKYNHKQNFPLHVKNYVGKLSLADTAALISQAGFFLGNDGSLSHIAAALKIPTFIISGPTDPQYWTVKGLSTYNITKNLDCQPCAYGGKYPKAWKYNYIGCPIGMKCMTDLSVVDVLNYINEKIKISK